jgi:uncharacterized membrane protein
MNDSRTESWSDRPARLAPALLLGIGLGGFIDGILLHQILQWHHLVSHETTVNTVAGLEQNTLADGLFHVFALVAVTAGVVLAFHYWWLGRPAPSWKLVTGGVFVGWGLFNLVEGLVNHHILGIHHVRDDIGSPLGWDLAFLAFSVALIVAGALTVRSARSASNQSASR